MWLMDTARSFGGQLALDRGHVVLLVGFLLAGIQLIAQLVAWCAILILRRKSLVGWLAGLKPGKGSILQIVLDALRPGLGAQETSRQAGVAPNRPDWELPHGSLANSSLSKVGPVVRSRKRTYRITSRLAEGDLCEVFRSCSRSRRSLLKLGRDTQANELLRKEYDVLRQLRRRRASRAYGDYLPRAIDHFRVGDRKCTAFSYREGFLPAKRILQRYPDGLDGRHLAWMFNRLLEVLGYVHREGWLHGAVLPPHLLFNAKDHGLLLVGWTHSEPAGAPLRVAPIDYKAWYPPECIRRRPATPATDIFLAAKSIVWFAGGDPLSDTIPPHLPVEFRNCLMDCLLDSQAMRPQDAWSLHCTFAHVLREVYGAPRYHHLDLS